MEEIQSERKRSITYPEQVCEVSLHCEL